MGDRTGCRVLDRTNGYESGNNYIKVKQSKLAVQNDELREALRSRKNVMRSDIFKGVSINVNGRTQPTADELKRLIFLHGGDYHPYYRYQTTKFMIATNLSAARMRNLRPDDRIVKPEWITESIKSKCLLPYEDYQLFAEEARGKTGSTAPISLEADKSSKQPATIAESYAKSYKKTKQKPQQPAVKYRDIREMFGKTVRKSSQTSVSKSDS